MNRSSDRIIFIEDNYLIITAEQEVTDTFSEFFSYIVTNLPIHEFKYVDAINK